tara:strand:- start:217 stop:393 length:177 start_codon:yes stop_codon:yes gene_type:complete
MERDFIIAYTSEGGETFHIEKSGTYKQVESWAYLQKAERNWFAFGIKDDFGNWAEDSA